MKQRFTNLKKYSVAVAPELEKELHNWGVNSKIIDKIKARTELGVSKYGTELHTHNGRCPLKDLEEELLDALQYAKQAQMMEGGKSESTKFINYNFILTSLVRLLVELQN